MAFVADATPSQGLWSSDHLLTVVLLYIKIERLKTILGSSLICYFDIIYSEVFVLFIDVPC